MYLASTARTMYLVTFSSRSKSTQNAP